MEKNFPTLPCVPGTKTLDSISNLTHNPCELGLYISAVLVIIDQAYYVSKVTEVCPIHGPHLSQMDIPGVRSRLIDRWRKSFTEHTKLIGCHAAICLHG